MGVLLQVFDRNWASKILLRVLLITFLPPSQFLSEISWGVLLAQNFLGGRLPILGPEGPEFGAEEAGLENFDKVA